VVTPEVTAPVVFMAITLPVKVLFGKASKVMVAACPI